VATARSLAGRQVPAARSRPRGHQVPAARSRPRGR